MLSPQQTEQLITLLAALDRDALISQFASYRANFPVDFTAEFLDKLPTERLRHIFLAMCLHCQQVPVFPQLAAT